MALTTLARIRALSGFRPKRVVGDALGTGNGSNVVFAPHQFACFVSPTNDAPQTSEITVKVNGVSVGINSIAENAVVLSAAPAGGAAVTADYWGHNLSSAEITIARDEVEAEVYGKLIGMYAKADLEDSPLISRIVAMLAAANLGDQAYNEMGANTPSTTVFPPDRLRRVAYALLEEVMCGVITLVDTTGTEIPIIVEVDAWIEETTYGSRDRLFENDQFYADSEGVLTRYSDSSPWRWDPTITVSDDQIDDLEHL